MAIEEYKIQKVNPILRNKPRYYAAEIPPENCPYCAPSDILDISPAAIKEYDNLHAKPEEEDNLPAPPKECDKQQHRAVVLYRPIYPYLEYND